MATSHSIVIDAPRVLDSPQIRLFCCLMNRYLREKTKKKKYKIYCSTKVSGQFPDGHFPNGYFSEKPFYLFILTFIYRWYTKVAGTNEFQQKIYKITLTAN